MAAPGGEQVCDGAPLLFLAAFTRKTEFGGFGKFGLRKVWGIERRCIHSSVELTCSAISGGSRVVIAIRACLINLSILLSLPSIFWRLHSEPTVHAPSLHSHAEIKGVTSSRYLTGAELSFFLIIFETCYCFFSAKVICALHLDSVIMSLAW